MSKDTVQKVDLAKASKEELLDFIEKSNTTIDPSLSTPVLREKAMEIQQSFVALKDSDDLDSRAKAASDVILGNDSEETSSDSEETSKDISNIKSTISKASNTDIDSTNVQPHDGESSSINSIIDESRTNKDGNLDETIEEKILREQKQKKDDFRTARFVVAADAEIREYHIDAKEKHKAKITDVCFFLLKGTNLNTFTTPYTKIPGVRLRKETPYRSLDLELKYFRRKRGMFGECAYQGIDKVGA